VIVPYDDSVVQLLVPQRHLSQTKTQRQRSKEVLYTAMIMIQHSKCIDMF
jgi:ribosomal protein L32